MANFHGSGLARGLTWVVYESKSEYKKYIKANKAKRGIEASFISSDQQYIVGHLSKLGVNQQYALFSILYWLSDNFVIIEKAKTRDIDETYWVYARIDGEIHPATDKRYSKEGIEDFLCGDFSRSKSDAERYWVAGAGIDFSDYQEFDEPDFDSIYDLIQKNHLNDVKPAKIVDINKRNKTFIAFGIIGVLLVALIAPIWMYIDYKHEQAEIARKRALYLKNKDRQKSYYTTVIRRIKGGVPINCLHDYKDIFVTPPLYRYGFEYKEMLVKHRTYELMYTAQDHANPKNISLLSKSLGAGSFIYNKGDVSLIYNNRCQQYRNYDAQALGNKAKRSNGKITIEDSNYFELLSLVSSYRLDLSYKSSDRHIESASVVNYQTNTTFSIEGDTLGQFNDFVSDFARNINLISIEEVNFKINKQSVEWELKGKIYE